MDVATAVSPPSHQVSPDRRRLLYDLRVELQQRQVAEFIQSAVLHPNKEFGSEWRRAAHMERLLCSALLLRKPSYVVYKRRCPDVTLDSSILSST